jgi:hypothetical protein
MSFTLKSVKPIGVRPTHDKRGTEYTFKCPDCRYTDHHLTYMTWDTARKVCQHCWCDILLENSDPETRRTPIND